MIDCLCIIETDKVIHTMETDIVKLVVEIESFGMNFDEVDKETRSSDGLQLKQADLSCVHALNELHLHQSFWGERHALLYYWTQVWLEEPMKDQPLSANASPTTLSPGHIADSNPEEDEEDPEEDPADYPANEGDNSDDESSDDDKDDDDVEKDEEDEEEEEHLAPADPSAVPTDDPVPLS
ncbi:hypothetical protein Tco_0534299 [Tanacetum coccineum]